MSFSDYQDEHCGGTLYVSRQTRLRLTQSYPSKTGPYHPQSTGLYQQNEDCQVELIANHGFQLMVFFKSLDISSQDNCTSDWLMVTDGNSTSNLTLTGKQKIKLSFLKSSDTINEKVDGLYRDFGQ